ncbi:MAG: hypothetical protein DWQ37_16585 [Planctomycetota bacterium]|mgnify:CR=1 FL=1|nr:MAG: hypothetical protein DWQ37_16585 [Planctomycetota bacterium]
MLFEVLEDRTLMSADPVEPVFHDLLSVEVVGRSILYNNSSFDGNDPAANAADDAALATDKVALLPGQTASFANYTSYSRGINAVAVDIAGLPTATLTADDFAFRVGNVNDPASWSSGPQPTTIALRPDAGPDESTRVTLMWPDGAIQKQWLEVTVKATVRTGLSHDDVFYFGNAVGESGNSPTDAIVDAVDEQAPLSNPGVSVPVTSPYDYNRDGNVDAGDAAVAEANATSSETSLRLIAPPQIAATPVEQRKPIELFNWGDGGYPIFYAPALVTTNSGVVLAFAEGRSNITDQSSYAIVMRRSLDGGATWSPVQHVVKEIQVGSEPRTGSPTPVVDRVTSEVFLVYNRTIQDVWVTRSSDDGQTWSAPVEITESVKVTEGNNPGPPGAYPDTPWGWNAIGPGHGIQLQQGDYAGRLLIPADHRETADVTGVSWSHVIYSDDHGQTWQLGGGFHGNENGTPSPSDYSNENTLVELDNGFVYMSARVNKNSAHYRGKSYSFDGGISWLPVGIEGDISSTQVQGSLLRVNEDVIVFASPSNPLDNERQEMTIWISYDGAFNWTRSKVVFFGFAGYSDMTLVGPDTLLLAYNRGHVGGALTGGANSSGAFYSKIGLARINLRWLESDEPYHFEWYFNEEAPGQPATITGPAVQDYGPWDQRAWIRGNVPQYVEGRNGDSALQLTTATDNVVLSQGTTTPLQLRADVGLTAEVVLKTTATSGVIIGTQPTIQNWTLKMVGGHVQFSLFDLVNNPTITSDLPINDGAWHHVAAVRDVNAGLLRLYVDGVEAATAVADMSDPLPLDEFEVTHDYEPVVLGAYNTGAEQLAFVVDAVRFTHAALAPAEFLDEAQVVPKPPPPEPYPSNAPTTIPGLQLWLPPYRPDSYFGDFTGLVDPLPLEPFEGMATRSARDASSNAYEVRSDSALRQVLYSSDEVIGPHWEHVAAPGAIVGSALQVPRINGPDPKNFYFVQNTGVFTLSIFARVETETGGVMTLFDTSDAKTTLPGFSLYRETNGALTLKVTASGSVVRFQDSTPAGVFQAGQWYHVAVVGSGPGNPVAFYLTPVGEDAPTSYTSPTMLTGPNGNYPSGAGFELFIGSRTFTSNTFTIEPVARPSTFAPFNGGLVNAAVYDTALTPEQIQQLFLHGKGIAPEVVGRHVFYNGSKFDGFTSGVSVSDDLAVAPDKTAYLPGSGPATFANITSYSRGINGIIVDLQDAQGAITQNDFHFKVGANNAPSTWIDAPAPSAFSVRPGAGLGGSDRVEIIWPNGAIANTWLQVVVEGNDAAGGFNTNTGLAASDVFYFGNRIGETGSGSPTLAVTSAQDEIAARNNAGFGAAITNVFDFDRSGVVSAVDNIIARSNTGTLIKINLTDPPAAPQTASLAESTPAVAVALSMPVPTAAKDEPPAGSARAVLLAPRRRPSAAAPPLEQNGPAVDRALLSTDAVLASLELGNGLLDQLLADLRDSSRP